VRLDAPHSAATDRAPVDVRHQKSAAPVGDLLGIEPEEVRAFLGVAIVQLSIESADEPLDYGRGYVCP
jgi:hypothetical protein